MSRKNQIICPELFLPSLDRFATAFSGRNIRTEPDEQTYDRFVIDVFSEHLPSSDFRRVSIARAESCGGPGGRCNRTTKRLIPSPLDLYDWNGPNAIEIKSLVKAPIFLKLDECEYRGALVAARKVELLLQPPIHNGYFCYLDKGGKRLYVITVARIIELYHSNPRGRGLVPKYPVEDEYGNWEDYFVIKTKYWDRWA